MKIRPLAEIKQILASVLPEYEPISKAPTVIPDGVNEMAFIEKERKKDYKSVDWYGNVFLSKNPLVGNFDRERKLAQGADRSTPVILEGKRLMISCETFGATSGMMVESKKGSWNGGGF